MDDLMTNNESIGDRIRKLRKEKKITQRAMSKKMGTSEVAISNWETGKNELRGENLLRVAEVLGVSSTWLQTGNGSKYVDDYSAIERIDTDLNSFTQLFLKLEPHQQQRYIDELKETVELNKYRQEVT